MKCCICEKYIQFPEKFYSTGPLIQRGYCCEECFRTWVVPYREKELKKVPDSIVWIAKSYYAEDHSERK